MMEEHNYLQKKKASQNRKSSKRTQFEPCPQQKQKRLYIGNM